MVQIRNPNIEIRNKFKIRNPKVRNIRKSGRRRKVSVLRSFGPSNLFRISIFGFRIVCLCIAFATFLLGLEIHTAALAASTDPLAKTAAWQAPTFDQVRGQVAAWLDGRHLNAVQWEAVMEPWAEVPADVSGDVLLERLARSFAAVDPHCAALVAQCRQQTHPGRPAEQAWLDEQGLDPLVARNMRLLYGRWLVHQQLHDEARQQLTGLEPNQVVAPATLLFYQAVVYHTLLDKEPGLQAVERLLAEAEQSPRRYVALARLMEQDLEKLEDDTLDHIARRMDDIRRRLELGRAGQRVRTIEDGVIESLDKLIKKLEEQQQQAAAAAAAANSNQSSRPAQDSQIIGGKGPGQVTKRDVGSGDGWGDMPPRQREAAMQQIGRDFPSHYRDAIEQYFRRLASESSP